MKEENYNKYYSDTKKSQREENRLNSFCYQIGQPRKKWTNF